MERFKRNSIFDLYRGKGEQSGDNVLLRALFQSFDRNGSGYLEHDDLASISAEMGLNVTTSDIEEIFRRVDATRDARIDFDEFFNWWTFARHENKLFANIIKIGLKARKLVTRASEYVRLFALEPDDNDVFIANRISLLLGEQPDAGGFRLKGNVKVGLSELRRFEEISEGLTVDIDGLGIVVKLAAEYPVKAQAALEALVERILELCALLLPDWEEVLRYIHISYAKDQSSVRMAVNITHPLVKFFMDEYHQLILLFNRIDDIATLNIEFIHQHSLLELLNANKSTFLLLFEGFRLAVTLEAKKKIATKLRERAFALISAPVVKEGRPNMILKTFHPLLMLLSNIRCDFRFKTPENFLQFLRSFASKGFVPPEAITLNGMLDDVRREGDFAHFLEDYPIVGDIIDTFMENFQCNADICLRLPLVCATVSCQTRGLKEIVKYLRK